MGRSRELNYTRGQKHLASAARALAHPARLAIIEFLRSHPGCICREIVDDLGLSQATISQHLKVLKSAGFIRGETDPPAVCYCLDEENLIKAAAAFSAVLKTPISAQKSC